MSEKRTTDLILSMIVLLLNLVLISFLLWPSAVKLLGNPWVITAFVCYFALSFFLIRRQKKKQTQEKNIKLIKILALVNESLGFIVLAILLTEPYLH
jgi:undecaprenyl pyrophosphate phosphatase UppP